MTLFHVTHQKKCEVWNHFVERWAVDKLGGGNGVTGARLKYIKPIIWQDDHFWYDVVHRHGINVLGKTIDSFMIRDPALYNHCLGNFWGMIYQSLMRHGKIKP